VVPEDGQ
jgi:hypothetical protein